MPLNLYGWDCESTVWFTWAFEKLIHWRSYRLMDAFVRALVYPVIDRVEVLT